MALKKMYDEDEDMKKPSPFKKVPLYDAGGEVGGSGEAGAEGSAVSGDLTTTGDQAAQSTFKDKMGKLSTGLNKAFGGNDQALAQPKQYSAPDWHVNLYDQGGEANTNNAAPMDRGSQIFVMGRADGGNGSKVNLYDEGGEATVQGTGGSATPPQDDPHQLAVIEQGERVLTPAETAAYDTEHPQEAAAHAQPTQMARIDVPGEGFMSHADNPYIKPLPGQKPDPMAGVAPVAPAQTDNTIDMRDKPGNRPITIQAGDVTAKGIGDNTTQIKNVRTAPPPNAPDPTGAMKDIFQQQKEKAAMSGNLVEMGKALIGEKQLTKADMPQYEGPGAVSPETGMAVTGKEGRTAGKENYHEKIAGFDRAIQKAYDEGVSGAVDPNDAKKRVAFVKEAKLEYQRSHPEGAAESAHPGIGGKILHGLSTAGQIAGEVMGGGPILAQIPGTDLNRRLEQRSAETMGKEATAEQAQEATTEETKARTKQLQNPEHNWEPMAGEQYTAYDVKEDGSQGQPVAQMYRNKITGQMQWRPTPTMGGTPATTQEGGGAAGQQAVQFGTRQMTKPQDRLLDDAGVGRFNDEAKTAANRIPPGAGINVVPPTFDKTDTPASAKVKMDSYNRDINTNLATYNAEQRKKAADDAKEKQTQMKNDGYVDKVGGGVTRVNEYEARNNPDKYIGTTFQKMSPGDEQKDKTAMKQLSIIQGSTNEYTNAAQAYADAQTKGTLTRNGKPISDKNPIQTTNFFSPIGLSGSITDQKEAAEHDRKNLAALMTKAGWADFDLKISQGGTLTLPALSAFTESLSQQLTSKFYNELSDQAKDLLKNYRAQLSAVPAYIKAVSGIGRQNKETLDLELSQILNPTFTATDILGGQERFQQNLDRAETGFPDNYPGVESPAKQAPRTKGAPANKPAAGQPTGRRPGNPFAGQ